MLKNKAGWVALIVLAIATVLMIFFVMPNLKGIKDQPTAETPATGDAKPGDTTAADAKGARPTATTETAEKPADATTQPKTDAKPAETAAVDPTAGWTIPGFDVLRVEPDGSTVIAGKAQPGTKLEIMNGDTVIATADVGSSGDFAAVFDKPLAAGDYQLTLRSVGDAGASKTSQEVATVSIPKDGTGELLAMVSRPGEASRILTTPDAKPAEDAQASTDTKPAEAASTETAAATDQPAADPAGAKTLTTPATDTADAATKAAPTGTGTASGDTAKATAGETPADTAQADTPATDTSNTAAATTPASGATSGKSEVAVSAVEIEGRKVFVAGSAKPGSIVRIYANDVLVGEIKADEQGRFVVDGTLDLAVGNHTIRADMLSADGSKVEFRASVPFDRPEGEQVAAVAQPDASGRMASFDGGSFDGLRAEAGKALAILKGLFDGGKVPNAEQLAAARSATEIALNSLANFKVTGTLDASIGEVAARTSTAASEALALLKAVPQDAASVSAALDKIEAAVGSALMPRTDGTGASATDTTPEVAVTPAQDTATANPAETPADATTQPATTSTEQAETPATQPETAADGQSTDGSASSATASSEQSTTGPETVEQAPLKQSKTSVIIRRGDTLWQISRRVYGAGVRYTTIYLANEDQITDPNRILPGQVFGVPDEAMSEQESEAIHRKRLTQKP
ncbi:LysM peptidoglycan-binding domain-containing protein [Rhizobium sp. 32-5/1]|uniref:LysM peptidoglycan-binding domain-containing protein n=1 Tax=Rhizobium sp. 32-5/1 TaxID=3019602 RepID=UPI00240D2D37|nr:LysM peptidoglycan-binding domain-containing protein [Rhizobium sp. 32-5/1]WEZ83914.1 LysM peptidoglycan-binding domain-containing protein [Rhizobium sp. 32-5/1]